MAKALVDGKIIDCRIESYGNMMSEDGSEEYWVDVFDDYGPYGMETIKADEAVFIKQDFGKNEEK